MRKNLRYVKSWWNSVSELHIPTFYQTVPQYVGEVDNDENLSLTKYGAVASLTVTNSLTEQQEEDEDPATVTVYTETYATRLLYQYVLKDEEIDITLGHKPYHYIYILYDSITHNPTELSDKDSYQCTIRFNFPSSETEKWGSQNYMYQITLVSGILMHTRLDQIFAAHENPEDEPDTDAARYEYVKVQWPTEFQPDIDVDSPLGYIETPEPILQPTKLYVYNNLRTII